MSDNPKELREAIERILLLPEPKTCRACACIREEWWSYCAMCGYHIAGGETVETDRVAENEK